MISDQISLQKFLSERLCQDVRLVERQDGAVMIRTYFEFPDGDRYAINITEQSAGTFRLSDLGHTLMEISYKLDINSLYEGTRRAILERIMEENSIQWEGRDFFLDTSLVELPEALFRFIQALTRIYDITLLSRTHVESTFNDDLSEIIFALVEEERIQREYHPHVPNAEAYPVDYYIKCSADVPLFLFGVSNQSKARLITIKLSHYHRYELQFNSILIFDNQSKISRMDLTRLSDVGGEMISSLDAKKDLERKLLQHISA